MQGCDDIISTNRRDRMGIWATTNNTRCNSINDWNEYFSRHSQKAMEFPYIPLKISAENLIFLAQRGIVPILLVGVLYKRNFEFISGYEELYTLLAFLRNEIAIQIDRWPDKSLNSSFTGSVTFFDLNESAQLRFKTAKIECLIISVDSDEDYRFLKKIFQ